MGCLCSKPNPIQISLLNMTKLDFLGTARLEVTHNNYVQPILFHIVPLNLDKVMLGGDGLDNMFPNWAKFSQKKTCDAITDTKNTELMTVENTSLLRDNFQYRSSELAEFE